MSWGMQVAGLSVNIASEPCVSADFYRYMFLSLVCNSGLVCLLFILFFGGRVSPYENVADKL